MLLLLLGAGAVNLMQPLGWDQAIFTMAGRRIHEGALLYRDVWDVKQPGLFGYYLVGGTLFGFSEIGIHAFELLYWLVFAFFAQRVLRPCFSNRWVASLAPFLMVGWYYAYSGDWHLTQAEGLAGCPLFFCMWFAARGEAPGRDRGRDLAISGVFGAGALLLKLVFLPLVAGFWLIALVRSARAGGGAVSPVRGAFAILVGAAVPFLVAAGYFIGHRTFALAWDTNVIYPFRISPPRPAFRFKWLVDGLAWFLLHWASLLALCGFAAATPAGGPRGRLMPYLLAWCVLGAGVILVQQLSWWQYHYLLLMVPIGVLAAIGLDALVDALRGRELGRRGLLAVTAALLLLLLPAMGALGLKAMFVAQDGFGLTPASRLRHEVRMSRGGAYGRILADVAPLAAPGSRPGPIYVAGNPLYHWLSHRDSSLPRFGGILATYASAEEWAEVANGLRKDPPPYIFVQNSVIEDLGRSPMRSRPFFDLLSSDYVEIRRSPMGVWWERRAGATHGS